MKTIKLITVCSLFFIFYSCGNKEINMYPLPENEDNEITYISCSFEKIVLDTTITTSLEGKLEIRNNQVCFFDYLSCYFLQYDTTGKDLGRRMGIGK